MPFLWAGRRPSEDGYNAMRKASIAAATERTSLLPENVDEEAIEDGDADEAGSGNPKYGGQNSTWRLALNEIFIIFKGAIPVVLAYMLQMSLQTISVLIVGRRSPEDLAIAAFAYMWAMSTAWLLALGGTTALDTLASAAFTGSKNPHDLGVLLQRAIVVLSLLYLPVMLLWIFAEPIFLALGQDPEISRGSARFLWCLMPGGLGYIYFECMKKFLQSQEIMRAGTYVLLITSPLNAALNYLFVYTFNIGLLGAPIATAISYWLSFLGLVLYARFVQGSDHWGGWSRKCLNNLWTFTKLVLLGVVHIGTEWWAFEIIALVAGQLGNLSLASQSVIMTADQIMNTIPFGVGVALSSRVGNLLGDRNARGAALAAHMGAVLSIMLGLVVLTILLATRDNFARLFNNDQAVVDLTAEVLPAVALFQIADGLNGSCGGSLRGMGRQHVGAAVNIVSYYCLALPVGVWLAWHGWGLQGLWWGNCAALYITGTLEWLLVAITDWKKQVANALERLDESSDSDC